MINQHKQPTRKCIACGDLKNKKELIRVIRTPEGNIELDASGKKNGRGAYICKNLSCFEKAAKTKAFNKAFSCEIPSDVYELLKKELSELGE